MGKTAEDMKNLSTLISEVKEPAPIVDEMTAVIKKSPGRPKKKKQEYGIWCGLQTPGEVYNVCVYLKELLEDQDKYVKALDIQIFNCAVQFYLYNQLITKMITQAEPVPVRALTTTSEAFRRALQSLGLTITDKKAGITKEQTKTDPTKTFMDKMNSEEEDVIVKKTKKKSSK